MGGGGGNDGYEQRQQAIEDKKQAARDKLNVQFGIGDAQTIGRDRFTTKGKAGAYGLAPGDSGPSDSHDPEMIYTAGTPDTFDQGGFDADVAAAKANGASREALYQGVRDNAFNAGRRRLDEQKGDAGRKLKFELFARGLNGGSEDINQNALLGRTYQQGVMDLGAKADSAKAQFRGDDENTRLSLLQAIDSGTDQGSAISSAMNQMKVNADRASADANGTTLGDLFSTGELLFNKSKAAQGKAAGTEWWNQYQTGSGGKGSAARTGQITEV